MDKQAQIQVCRTLDEKLSEEEACKLIDSEMCQTVYNNIDSIFQECKESLASGDSSAHYVEIYRAMSAESIIRCSKDESGNECPFTTFIKSLNKEKGFYDQLVVNKDKFDESMKETCKSNSCTTSFLKISDIFNDLFKTVSFESMNTSIEFMNTINSGVTYLNSDECKAQSSGNDTPTTTPATGSDAPSNNGKSQATDGDSKTSGTTTIKASSAILASICLFLYTLL